MRGPEQFGRAFLCSVLHSPRGTRTRLSVSETRLMSLDAAREFTTEHWPAHNRAQGIEWQQTDFALGAFEGPQCRGAAIYKVVGGMAYLEQLVVADGFTGRGIGTRLLEAFEAHARELGCHVIQLETAETQAPRFYERHGYRRVATWPDSRFHLDWHLYRKPIAE